MDLRIFRHRGFVVGVMITSLTFGTFFGSIVLVPLWLQTSMGYTATWAGYAGSLNGVLAFVAAPFVAKMVGKVDPRALVSFGVICLGLVSFWRAHFTTQAGFWWIALPFLAQGFCLPFFFIPTTGITLSSVLPQETASAAGLSNFIRTTSAAFATSIMTTIWDQSSSAQRSDLVGKLNDAPGMVDGLMSHGLTAAQATAQLDRTVEVQAVMLATNQLFLTTSLVFVAAGLLVWLAPRPRAIALGGGH